MAQFPILRLTRAGQDLAGMSQGGGKLIFVRAELGDGQLGEGESIEMLHALKRRVMQLPLQGYLNEGNGKARLRFVVDNSSLTAGFFNREIGIVAKMEGGDEQLYAYTNAGNYADYIPSKDTPIDSEIIDLHILIGNASHVVLETQNGAYATKIELEEHRTAAELDHPEKSVKRKHLADNVYTLPKPEAANNARFLRNDGTWQQVTADNIGACNKADVAGIYRKIGDQIVDRNTDWNTLTEPMTYIVSGASIDDMHHAPSEYNFGVLDVLRTFRDPEKRIIQIYYPHFSQQMLEKGGMWIRFSNNDSWTQWRHIPTKAENDDRYVKKSGDKLTGPLFAPTIQAANGFEVQGDAGLFFKKHGGGWYMADDDWMRVYGGRGIHTSGKIACDGGFEGNLRGRSDATNGIAILTGVINDGGTIPLPDGYTESQCRWMVSPKSDNYNLSTWDIDESGGQKLIYTFYCYTEGRKVVCRSRHVGDDGDRTFLGSVNYMIIGVR